MALLPPPDQPQSGLLDQPSAPLGGLLGGLTGPSPSQPGNAAVPQAPAPQGHPAEKRQRDIFVYEEAKDPKNADHFGNCDTCIMFCRSQGRCTIHGPEIPITERHSCGLYIEGDNATDDSEIVARVTPEESGLVDRDVRCENCGSFDGRSRCNFYVLLNRLAPQVFALDPSVNPKGCCNAQVPNGSPASSQPQPASPAPPSAYS